MHNRSASTTDQHSWWHFLGLVLLCLSLAACVPTAPNVNVDAEGVAEVGREGGPCGPQNGCFTGLSCLNKICRATTDTSSPDQQNDLIGASDSSRDADLEILSKPETQLPGDLQQSDNQDDPDLAGPDDADATIDDAEIATTGDSNDVTIVEVATPVCKDDPHGVAKYVFVEIQTLSWGDERTGLVSCGFEQNKWSQDWFILKVDKPGEVSLHLDYDLKQNPGLLFDIHFYSQANTSPSNPAKGDKISYDSGPDGTNTLTQWLAEGEYFFFTTAFRLTGERTRGVYDLKVFLPCSIDLDCSYTGSGKLHCVDGRCRDCKENSHCTDKAFPEQDRCHKNNCVGCVIDGDCAASDRGQLCDQLTTRCGCKSGDDCPANYPICATHASYLGRCTK